MAAASSINVDRVLPKSLPSTSAAADGQEGDLHADDPAQLHRPPPAGQHEGAEHEGGDGRRHPD